MLSRNSHQKKLETHLSKCGLSLDAGVRSFRSSAERPPKTFDNLKLREHVGSRKEIMCNSTYCTLFL